MLLQDYVASVLHDNDVHWGFSFSGDGILPPTEMMLVACDTTHDRTEYARVTFSISAWECSIPVWSVFRAEWSRLCQHPLLDLP